MNIVDEADEGNDRRSVSLQEQVMELQLIESMYPEHMQFFNDKIQSLVLDVEALKEYSDEVYPTAGDGLPIEFVFTLPSSKIEVMFTLPEKYPHEDGLKCHVRLLDTKITSSQLKRLQSQANTSLVSIIQSSLDDKRNRRSDACDVNILSVIQWVEDSDLVICVIKRPPVITPINPHLSWLCIITYDCCNDCL